MAETPVVNLLQQLVRIESPYFHEAAVMNFAAAWLESNGVPVKRHCYYAKGLNFHG